ncbi:mandelate racemase/muconate lactonizing enzyme family protein [Aestuariispira insulae]|uniref:L-alanine-DL-glutamate epimerase-like enolase superfamily enzyme n=1 Tax=Aestuariispira insulae TaxID=1461337 RepID=A0A3D9H461_9PROT|nr:mandelate racemase/muconate lactonizing enzyme family protein [Aestuariispira insulae]RED44275.1 L-alanine-DL-glutamate epimerase-like enolase superfamily enzyme [Aestuariispira insulae]
MNIKSLETFTNEFVSLVRVTTTDGETGWGQISPYTADVSAHAFHRLVAPHALGKSAGETNDDIGGLIDFVSEKEHKFSGSVMCRALCGLDTALWDLHGKRKGKPVVELLGGTARPFRVYASSMRRDITPEDEARRMAELRDAHGYDAFKFRVGSECGHDQDEWPGRTEAVVKQVRAALGDDATLLVDANSCYTPKKAIEVGRMLEDHGVVHFEEPCPYWELDWTREVTAALNLDVTGGEQDNSIPLWKYMINSKVVDVIQPDICYLGGLSRTLRVAGMGAAAGLPCTPHSANLSMVTVFTLHMMGAIPNAGPYVEFSIEPNEGYYPWQEGLFDPVLVARDGKVQIPEGPGWGVEVSEDWLAAADYQISELD